MYVGLLEERLGLLFGRNNPSLYPITGLKEHGPYRPPENASKIILRPVYPKKYKSDTNVLLTYLTKGFPQGGVFEGFHQIYKIGLDIQEPIELNINPKDLLTLDIKNYANFLNISLTEDQKRKDPVIYLIVLPQTPKWEKESPYYKLKYYLLKHNIVSQMINQETIQQKNLQWVLFNIANSIFTKAGGIPWILSCPISLTGHTDTTIILGVGVTSVYYDQGGAMQRRYIGYVTIYGANGVWYGFLAQAYPYNRENTENIKSKLSNLLISAVDEVLKVTDIDNLDILIHYSGKELSLKEEEEVISGSIRNLEAAKGIKISFAITRIIKNCIYRVVCNTKDGYTHAGSYIKFGNNLSLLVTSGKYNKKIPMGLPRPMLVSIRRTNVNLDPSIEDNIIYSVFGLSRLNWRSVLPIAREPVTIKYAREISYILGSIEKIGILQHITSHENFKRKMWFI